jgi:peptidoglycan/LPS O-acetylase OafA/YrhL
MHRAAPTAGSSRFAVMDGLRGVAAMAVVLCHSWPDGGPVQNGPLAVDFFFLLSGFVIAHAYEDELRAGLIRAFLVRRLIRLLPLVWLGAGGGFLVALIHTLTHSGAPAALPAVVSSGLLSLCLIPYLGPGLGEDTFSFNPPLWSLSFELAANLVYAVLARRLSSGVLVGIVATGLAVTVWGGGLGGGAKATLGLGVPRVACGFFGGVLLHRLHRAGRLPQLSGRFSVLSLALLSAVCCPWVIRGWTFLAVYILFALIIAGAVGARPGRLARFYLTLGVISYPLYALHWLTLFALMTIAIHFDIPYALHTPVVLANAVCAPFIAYAVALWYDAPLRRYITVQRQRALQQVPIRPAVSK